MNLYAGQKVVPVSKSIYGELHESFHWRRAKDIGQPFLFVQSIERDRVLLTYDLQGGGDYFLESDLVPFEEMEACCQLVQETLEELQQKTIVELEDKLMEAHDKAHEQREYHEKVTAEYVEEIKELEEDKRKFHERNVKLRSELEGLKSENTILDGKVYDLEIDLENAHGLIEKLKEELKTANLELGRVGHERDRKNTENEKLKARLYHVKKGFVEVLDAVDFN